METMCFSHIARELVNRPRTLPDVVPESNYGGGHVYTAITQLITTRLPGDPTAEPFRYPKPDLDKLFRSSLYVDFGSDVTPIQIWANLVRISSLGYVITPDFMAVLIDEIKKYAHCNG
jgi:hypothetical protein